MNDQEHLDDLLTRFGPKPKESFALLRTHGELIKGLRRKGASFETIYQVLEYKGVETSPTSIRRFCTRVLGEPAVKSAGGRGAGRKSKPPPARSQAAKQTQAGEPSVAETAKPHSVGPTEANRITGPRIAKVEFIEEPKI